MHLVSHIQSIQTAVERQIEERDICCGSFEAAGNARQMDGDALFCSFLHHLNPIFLQFRVILMPFCS